MGNLLLFGETDFTVGYVSYSMCNCCGATTTANGRFLRKTAFYKENFKFREAVKWGLKIFAPNYKKAHPYAKSGRTNRLGYVAVRLFCHYTATRKKYARIAIGNSMSSTVLRRYRDVVIKWDPKYVEIFLARGHVHFFRCMIL